MKRGYHKNRLSTVFVTCRVLRDGGRLGLGTAGIQCVEGFFRGRFWRGFEASELVF